MRSRVGFYGFLFHVVVIAAFLAARTLRGEQLGADLLFVAVPMLLLSSFLVYAFAVSKYVERRQGTQRSALADSLVGMLAECMIFTLAAAFAGLFEGVRRGPTAESGFWSALLTPVIMNILWAYATFFVHILLIGNAAGLVGWFLMKKGRHIP